MDQNKATYNPDLFTFKECLECLIEELSLQDHLRMKKKRVRVEEKHNKDNIAKLNNTIIKYLKQNHQDGLEYKDLKITLNKKPKRVYHKKDEKEQMIGKVLDMNKGVHANVKAVMDVLSHTKTVEHFDTLKIKKK